MIQEQDSVLDPSQLMCGTKGHDLTVLSASALLCPLLTAFITALSLEITCSCILFSSFSFPPSRYYASLRAGWRCRSQRLGNTGKDSQRPFVNFTEQADSVIVIFC